MCYTYTLSLTFLFIYIIQAHTKSDVNKECVVTATTFPQTTRVIIKTGKSTSITSSLATCTQRPVCTKKVSDNENLIDMCYINILGHSLTFLSDPGVYQECCSPYAIFEAADQTQELSK